MFVILVIFSLVGPFFPFFLFSYFAKLTPLLVHVEIRQKAYIFVFHIFRTEDHHPLSFPMIYECFCFSHLHLFVVVFLCSLLQVWMFYTQGASELSYWKTARSLFMQCSPPFFSFPGVCDKHNVPQIMVVLGCLFARKPMARSGCKYPLPASRKSIPNTDTFPARPYIRPDNTHISFLTKFLGQAQLS